ncbi:hypothetical protein [Curtobacterium sp. MCBA15_012]|uniref:hypothetical protein n=1 Tax=Curtobacterium sp. MCBA15_012 TaxID=1898738 RepID=UPI0008DD1334|nr:hypothetical protein [Curtobacterium sp. MCBA15_012]WIB00733.1 hypothetical protein QOL15_03295 [Curtobacterium sp. MCBA15_012]
MGKASEVGTAMTTAALALAAILALALFGLAFHFTSRSPGIVVASIVVIVSITWEVPNLPPLADLAGFQIYYLDLLMLTLAVIMGARLNQMLKNVGIGAWAWLMLGLVMLAAYVRGATQLGIPEATNEFRAYFYPFAAIGWALSLPWTPELTFRLVRRLSLILGWALSLVAFIHIARYGLGTTTEFVSVNAETEQTSRALVAGQALMLLMCLITCLHFWKEEGRRTHIWSALVFAVVIVLAQERTVWVAALGAAVAVGLAGSAEVRKRTFAIVAVAAVVGTVAVASGALAPLVNTLVGAAQNLNTYDARTEGWLNLIKGSIDQGATSVLFGEPFGGGFGRRQSGTWVTFAPHNWYVSLYLRVGLVGMGFFVACLIIAAVRQLRRRPPAAMLALVTTVMIFGWTYSWPWYICLFLAWAAVPSAASSSTQDHDPLNRRAREFTRKGLTHVGR